VRGVCLGKEEGDAVPFKGLNGREVGIQLGVFKPLAEGGGAGNLLELVGKEDGNDPTIAKKISDGRREGTTIPNF